MDPKTVAKVGGVVLFALVLFAFLFAYLSHLQPNSYLVKVRFKDTKGLGKQSVVRMQGVSIGEVTDIKLDTSHPPFEPIVTLGIRKEFSIPIDSKISIASGILITTAQVNVTPGMSQIALLKDDNAILDGEAPAGMLASFSPELSDTVKEMRGSLNNMTKRINTTFDKLNDTLESTKPILKNANQLILNTRDASGSAKDLIADPRIKQKLIATLDNFKQLSEQAKETSGALTQYVKDIKSGKKDPLRKASSRMDDIFTHIDAVIANTGTVVDKLTEQVTDPRLQQSLQETAELTRTTLARFNQIATDLHQLTGDPKLQNDLKATVENLKTTTEKSQQIVEKFNRLLGKIPGASSDSKEDGVKTPLIRVPKIQLFGDLSEQTEPNRLRVDLNAKIAISKKNDLILGIYDLGQNARLNAQYETNLSDNLAVRYGLHASRIGGGADYTINNGTSLQADLWDTRRPRLDLRANFKVSKDASVWFGADNIFRKTTPIIGIRLKN